MKQKKNVDKYVSNQKSLFVMLRTEKGKIVGGFSSNENNS